MMGYWYGMGAFGWIGMLLFWALIVLGIVYLVHYLNNHNQGTNRQSESDDSALEILRKRFATGEIDQDEFDQRRRGLN
jgi:putative membrane protein